MSMMSALIEHQRRLAEQAATHAAQQAEHEAAARTWTVMQTLPSRLIADAALARRKALEAQLGSALALVILRHVAACGGRWQGSAAELLQAIDVPMHVIHLGRRIRKIARHLRRVGIRVKAYPTYKRRLIVIDIHDPALFNEASSALSGQLH
jgi:hypothetical protein